MSRREEFLTVLKEQYVDEIHSAYHHCLSRTHCKEEPQIDYSKLQGLLFGLMRTARIDGLPEDEFHSLVESTLPDAFDVFSLVPIKKVA